MIKPVLKAFTVYLQNNGGHVRTIEVLASNTMDALTMHFAETEDGYRAYAAERNRNSPYGRQEC